MKIVSPFLVLIISTVLMSTESFVSSTTMGHQTIHRFTNLLDEGKYEEAAEDCLAEDAFFSSPKFTYKSRTEWLDKFPSFHKKTAKGNGPIFQPLEALTDKVYVRRGKANILGFSISVKETIQVNDDGKIVSSKMQKA